MPIGSIFETNEPLLHELLEAIHKAEIQLPDFQRGWVWDDYHIRSLIASVSTSYPIGAVMSEADKLGMHVFLGVGCYAWFDYSPKALQWSKGVARELYELYGHPIIDIVRIGYT